MYNNKNVYNNIINSINFKCKMDAIFINSENSRASNSHGLSLNLSDKLNLTKSDKRVA